MSHIVLITGGQRSGKSRYAENLALSLSKDPVYIATADVKDAEFAKRVDAHKARRGTKWTTIEEKLTLSSYNLAHRVILIDCVTLWCSNFCEYFQYVLDVETIFNAIKNEFERFTLNDATYIFVTNEIGWGGTSMNAIQRSFTDLQGLVNQYIASKADEVVLMVSGIAVKIK